MKAFYKGNITDENLSLPILKNRAFQYGDGMFETMLAYNGQVKYLAEHMSRLKQGLDFLDVSIGNNLDHKILHKTILSLFEKEGKPTYARVKIIAWRASGGTYAPLNDSSETIITLEESSQKFIKEASKVSFCQDVKNIQTGYSKFKSVNALQYVVAGLEKRKLELDDVIILDTNGNISECLTSNIFWVKNGSYFTPSLSTGCIEGVSRNVVIRELGKRNASVREVECDIKELLSADHVFTTNASGITHLLKINTTSFSICKEIEDVYKPF